MEPICTFMWRFHFVLAFIFKGRSTLVSNTSENRGHSLVVNCVEWAGKAMTSWHPVVYLVVCRHPWRSGPPATGVSKAWAPPSSSLCAWPGLLGPPQCARLEKHNQDSESRVSVNPAVASSALRRRCYQRGAHLSGSARLWCQRSGGGDSGTTRTA